jgi:tRNA threonylcarbamoyl adenosine modification protein YeaZ
VTRILVLDSALARCSAAVIEAEHVLAIRQQDGDRGQAALLPVMVQAVLADAAVSASSLALVAVTVGPGSFTGIRAGLALAHGIALAAGIPAIGVTVGEALADSLPALGGRMLWTAIDSRRGRVFLEQPDGVQAAALDALPRPTGPVALAGDAAAAVASRLAARGADVMLTDARLPQPRHIGMVALARHHGRLPARQAQPLYVDAPEARLPAGGLRPPPTP